MNVGVNVLDRNLYELVVMKDDKKVLKANSGRGTYARQACNHCRRR